MDKLKDSLQKALRILGKAEKPKLHDEEPFIPVPDQKRYIQRCTGLSAVESVSIAMIPMFPVLRFVFAQYCSPEERDSFRENLPFKRIFDICLYAENWQKQRKYHVFSTAVDLNCLRRFGGVGETSIYFKYGEDPRVSNFDVFFEQFKTIEPTEFPFLNQATFWKYLSYTRDAMQDLETREGLADPPSNPPPYTQAIIEQLKKEISLILTHPKPTLEELIAWSEFIQELRIYFDWDKIWNITEVILGEIDISKRDPVDFNEIVEDAIAGGLKRGLPPEKSQ